MTYREALDYIEDCGKYGSVPGIDSIRLLCEALGNPQDELKFIHIAGTNGKGSTLCYISTILSLSGMKVGRYVSPTISSYLERFQIDGKPMPKNALGAYMQKVKDACDGIVDRGGKHPTAFEIETAIAFLYMLDKKCDIVVLECGMGGRLDATNIVKTTIMEVFAHIDMDHMAFLGDNLEAIAFEKAGIIKENTVVVAASQSVEVSAVLKKVCDEKKCQYYEVDRANISSIKPGTKGQEFVYNGKRYKTGLIGAYQVDNAATAIEAVGKLNTLILNNNQENVNLIEWCADRKPVDELAVIRGLKEAVWPGRFQVLCRKPFVIADGAHNADAADRLKETMDTLFGDRRKIVIIGMFRDKDVSYVTRTLCADADMVLTVATPGNPRALSSVELAEVVLECNNRVTSTDSIEEAAQMAMMLADPETVVLACGSLAYLGRFIDYMNRRQEI